MKSLVSCVVQFRVEFENEDVTLKRYMLMRVSYIVLKDEKSMNFKEVRFRCPSYSFLTKKELHKYVRGCFENMNIDIPSIIDSDGYITDNILFLDWSNSDLYPNSYGID